MFGRDQLNRRSVLGLGLGALAGTALANTALAGCGSPSAGPGSSGKGAVETPSHVDPPTFDGAVVAEVDGVPIGYPHVPRKLSPSLTEPPGRGSTIRHFQITWSPPATPFEQNKWWQGLAERLNVDYQVTEVPAGNYDAKFATMIAGGDLPDVVQLLYTAGPLKAIKQGAFADLGDALGGDKVLKYPNLAHVRPDQWAACTINGGLYGIPIDIPSQLLEYRYRQDWAAKLGFPQPPTDAAEMAELLTAMTKGKPEGSKETWGVTAFPGSALGLAYAMYGVPNNWTYENGTLTHAIETPQFEEAIRWLVDLWQRGAFHPDALAMSAQTDRFRGFVGSGQVGIATDSAANFYNRGTPYNNAVRASDGGLVAFVPPGFDGKAEARFVKSSGSYGINAISAEAGKNPELLDEILRTFNYRRAPIGTEEWYYNAYGAEGVYNTRDDNGDPVPIDGTNIAADKGAIGYGLLPQTWIFPDVKDCVDNNSIMVRQAIADPTEGVQSDIKDTKQPALDQLFVNHVNQIVVGSRPLTELEAYRTAWRNQGGDQIRTDLEAQLKEEGS